MESVSLTEIAATVCFGLAIIHTFSVKFFAILAHRYPEGSAGENFFHLLGEVEVVFGLWAAAFLLFLAGSVNGAAAVEYLESRNFTEPAFVFVIMAVCSSRPILTIAGWLIETASKLLPLPGAMAFYAACLVIGPLLGSLITEPAAMTVTALILLQRFYRQGISQSLMYATLGVLFVNISIGGTLTPYAAPPVLMVAGKWGWDLTFMMTHFGWKAIIAVILTTILVTVRFRKELGAMEKSKAVKTELATPWWVYFAHYLFLVAIILSVHHMAVFVGIFLFYLGLTVVTKEYQDEVKLREGFLVAFFLGGLVILGGQQRWWLEPLLASLSTLPLYLGSMSLTAITDNAALTYLGSQVPTLSEASKYALVAGSVVGGGLTVIANAPNPAGYGILNDAFGEDGISPVGLFISALTPTGIAALCFWFL